MPLDTDANVALLAGHVVDVWADRGTVVSFVAQPPDLVALGWGPWIAKPSGGHLISLVEISLDYVYEHADDLDADLRSAQFGVRDFGAFVHRIETAVLTALAP